MPELPEVETVRRGLEPALAGARLARVVQRRPDLRFPLPERFAERLTGRRILSLGRRAKYLLARLDGAEVLVMHLGMSGRFTVSHTSYPDSPPPCGEGLGVGASRETGAGGYPPPPLRGTSPTTGEAKSHLAPFAHDTGGDPTHDHVVFETEAGARITYNDPRRFGFMDLIGEDTFDRHKLFAGLGPEPLGNAFSADYLAERARPKATDLKAFLLDQRVVAGLGNIYVCEALYRAGLSPVRAASSLAKANGQPSVRCERLIPAIRGVLEEAIAAGGSTLRDYRHADGELGYFQHNFKVYGREGQPCNEPDCRGMVARIVQSGRSSFYCSKCQN